MSEAPAVAHRIPRRTELGRYMPVSFSKKSWWRFYLERRRGYLAELPGPPTNQQAARIENMIREEWSALKADAEGTSESAKNAREHRRLFDRLLSDHVRQATGDSNVAASTKARRGPPVITLEEHMAQLERRQEVAK
jgi:hypothetical protein